MLETPNAARRVSAFADAVSPAGIRPLPGAARFALRLREADATGEAAGFRLDQPLNTFAAQGDRLSLRLGPNEWLLIGPEADADAIAAEIAAALGTRFHTLVDIGHRNVAIEVKGPHAADILNAGCPLDLFDARFPTGTATRTLLGKAEIVLMRLDDAPTYRVECWRSFATYVHDFLTEAAQEFDAGT
ncbi:MULTISPECIES: sarcosine oxidase subunit gamma family protein [Rhodomicrobium]|uniref:sarcosine oxidase subunit gamma n=1 Tax=Rhodomicrobium TaxID=1068 RepID=UPI000B4B0859|nr:MULTISPECIES: sarcosine oxidase subunit gamma family protein [Rhodomicrobium]